MALGLLEFRVGLQFCKNGSLNMKYNESKDAVKKYPQAFWEDGRLKRLGEIDKSSFKQIHRVLNPRMSEAELDSLYVNLTGSNALKSKECLKTHDYRKGITDSKNREADHIVECQHFLKQLKRVL